ncbi:MAG: HAD family hydrolase [Bacilli bacterium]|nr:HAD family hydrolase [Bacilli bacterium]
MTSENLNEIETDIDYQFDAVKKFHKAFNHPVSDVPVSLTPERALKRYDWMFEEICEFLEAVQDEDIVEQADAMIDVIYFALGTLVEIGVKPGELFRIVQHANMSKIWPDGKPHYNEDGKVIKPEGWENPHPKLEAAIQNMIIEAKENNNTLTRVK